MVEPAVDTRRYEMMIVVAPTVTEAGLPAVIDRVVGYVDAQEGEVEGLTYENPWGRRRLAYPIQNYQDAFYVLFYFDAGPDSITPLERALGLDEQVIRHLIVKYDPMADYLEMPALRRPGEMLVEEAEEETDAEVDAADELAEETAVAEAEAIVEAEAEEVVEEATDVVADDAEEPEDEAEAAEDSDDEDEQENEDDA